MPESSFSDSYEEDDDLEKVTIFDDGGRSLDCYIENSLELNNATYLLLMPVDAPVVILAGEDDPDDEDEEYAQTILIEDKSEIEKIFADAKAVLAELNLTLKDTAYTLTVEGELPALEDENLISLELDEEESEESSNELESDNELEDDMEPEELQILKSFYHEEQRYSLCTPLSPLLFVALVNRDNQLELLAPDNPELQFILQELLFDEFDEN
ncbi:MAG: DUF3727 domain-containing protein [Gomphosphaeria aponina SAG 52.96 = DSM 107014]|uniref:DUF3727 domain-containing protein n=1 Tax=Gomphosphaeria aponina SAG 52.96 = DSM 107014 TaxID=1521640 RepID=A0A941JMR0_9CHRO|nr:DUF3727 domain-containing protein [Gomphosphaeria aponina SAG 52.96 = DSM 107014]